MSEIDNKLTDGFAERLCDLMQENKTCADALAQESVSYTHLTLPTKLEV